MAAWALLYAVASREQVKLEERMWPSELNEFFTVGGVLGSGSFGEIWAATNRSSGEDVAIKVFLDRASEATGGKQSPILTWSSTDDEGRAQLQKAKQECATANQLKMASKPYANRICQCKEDHIDDGGPSYLVNELCGEEELLTWLKRNIMNTAANVEQFGGFVKMILEGLVQLHGIYVHRDLAPRNLMLSRTKEGGYDLKIIDFGQTVPEGTKHLPPGEHSYTPYEDYVLEVEDLAEHAVSWRDDVYALGSMVFMVLCHGLFPVVALADNFPEGFWQAGPQPTNPFETAHGFKARAIEHIAKSDAQSLCLNTMPESCRNDDNCKSIALSLVDLASKTMLCAEGQRDTPAVILEALESWQQLQWA